MTHGLRKVSSLAFVSAALAGCATHPIPDNYPLNFARTSTFDIVRTVRCEVKAGIERAKGKSNNKAHTGQIVEATSVGYHFTLIMNETNNLSDGLVKMVGSAKKGARKLNHALEVKGDALRSRDNERRFHIVEDLRDVEKADCPQNWQFENLSYPISGSLRVDDLAFTYIRLEQLTNFGNTEFPNPVTGEVELKDAKRTGLLSEHIAFHTSVSLGAVPKISLSVAAGSFGVQTGSITGRAVRRDSNDLIIAFGQDPNFHNREIREAIEEREALLAQQSWTGKKPIRAPRLVTAIAQANANSRNRVLFELARIRNLLDDREERSRFLGDRLLTFLRPPGETGPEDGQ